MEDTMIKKLYEFVSEKDWEGMTKYLSELKEKFKDKSDDQFMMKLLNPLSVHKDTVIHLAVHSKKEEPLKQILELVPCDMSLSFMTSVNAYGNTVLHEAAICRNLGAVKLLVKRTKEQIRMKNDSGETPLFRAAAFGNTKIVQFLADTEVISYQNKRKLKDIHRRKNSGASILRAAIQGKNFGTAFGLLKMDPELADIEDKYGSSLSYMMSNFSSVFKSTYDAPRWKQLLYLLIPIGWGYNDKAENIQTKDDDDMSGRLFGEDISSGSHDTDGTEKEADKDTKDSYWTYLSICSDFIISVLYWIYLSIWSLIIAGLPKARKMWKDKREYKFAFEVVKILIRSNKLLKQSTVSLTSEDIHEVEMTEKVEGKEEVKEDEAREIPLFTAIKKGNVKCVKYILKQYPRALELVNYRKQNILHVAAMYRQKEIFDFVREKEIPVLRLARQIDVDGYTISHSVADTKHYKEGTDHSSPVYQLQEELVWFNKVEEIVPSYYSMRHSRTKQMTAWKLFRSMHAEQHKAAQNWTKDTSRLCFAIAVFLTFFILGATFTVSGVTIDNNNGLSIVFNEPIFQFFTFPDIVSLFCSLIAAFIFLAILSWPLKIKSFYALVPRLLTFGFFLLNGSMFTTMPAYTWTTFNIILLADPRRGRMHLAFLIVFFLASIEASQFHSMSFFQIWKNVFNFILPSDSVLRFLKFAWRSIRPHLPSSYCYYLPLFFLIFLCLSCCLF